MLNCPVYAVVDFGEGPVRIRCTREFEHDEHRCEVIMTGVLIGNTGPDVHEVQHIKNVFDK